MNGFKKLRKMVKEGASWKWWTQSAWVAAFGSGQASGGGANAQECCHPGSACLQMPNARAGEYCCNGYGSMRFMLLCFDDARGAVLKFLKRMILIRYQS